MRDQSYPPTRPVISAHTTGRICLYDRSYPPTRLVIVRNQSVRNGCKDWRTDSWRAKRRKRRADVDWRRISSSMQRVYLSVNLHQSKRQSTFYNQWAVINQCRVKVKIDGYFIKCHKQPFSLISVWASNIKDWRRISPLPTFLAQKKEKNKMFFKFDFILHCNCLIISNSLFLVSESALFLCPLCPEMKGNSGINWSEGKVEATGTASTGCNTQCYNLLAKKNRQKVEAGVIFIKFGNNIGVDLLSGK